MKVDISKTKTHKRKKDKEHSRTSPDLQFKELPLIKKTDREWTMHGLVKQ